MAFCLQAVLLMSFHGWNTERLYEAWDVHSWLFHVKTSNEEEGMNAQLCSTLALDLSRYFTERQNYIYWLNFRNKMERFVDGKTFTELFLPLHLYLEQ